jgi:hypothetical protein
MADDYDPIADAWASYAAAQDALRARYEAAVAAGKVPAPLYPEPPATESQTIMTTRGNDA